MAGRRGLLLNLCRREAAEWMIFMETMGNLRRTHYCGTLRARDAGTQMTVAGSIAKCRDKGGVIFASLLSSCKIGRAHV